MTEKSWWQACRLEELEELVVALGLDELERLAIEISGSINLIQSQIQTRPDGSEEWVKSAKRAHGFLCKRKSIVSKEIQLRISAKREANAEKRDGLIDLARECVRNGDLESAVSMLIDLLDRRVR